MLGLLMTTSGMLSQNPSTNKETGRFITTVERDSAYNKIQRGKAAEQKILLLRGALQECDKTNTTYIKVIEVQNKKGDSLLKIVATEREIKASLESINRDQKKASGKKSFLSFVKGAGLGILLALAAVAFL